MLDKVSLNTRRLLVGLASLPALVCALNYYADFNWFGRLGGIAFAISMGILTFVLLFMGLTVRELEKLQDEQERRDLERYDELERQWERERQKSGRSE